MPQAWVIGTPICFRQPSDSDLGTADPPQRIIRSADRSRPFASGSMPIQIVGTPAVRVTFSASSRSITALGASSGPGMINDAPARPAA